MATRELFDYLCLISAINIHVLFFKINFLHLNHKDEMVLKMNCNLNLTRKNGKIKKHALFHRQVMETKTL